MKKITIKFNDEFNDAKVEFELPDGRKCSAYDIGFDSVYTGEERDINQYSYRRYGDEYGYDIDEFNGQGVVEYSMGGWNEYDEDILKFVKKVLHYYSKECTDNWRQVCDTMSFEMPERYLELVKNK